MFNLPQPFRFSPTRTGTGQEKSESALRERRSFCAGNSRFAQPADGSRRQLSRDTAAADTARNVHAAATTNLAKSANGFRIFSRGWRNSRLHNFGRQLFIDNPICQTQTHSRETEWSGSNLQEPSTKFAEWAIARHVEKHTPVPRKKKTPPAPPAK